MTRKAQPDLAALESSLSYAFNDRTTMVLALTHVGAAAKRDASYQRLEFLGDRVLGLVVADMLYRSFPNADEGELSRRLADLVRKESCAAVANRWDVEPHIRLAAGERGGPALRQAVLGDVCESLIGAVFVDGGFAAARELVLRAFAGQMQEPTRPLRDAKTALQEWAQGQALKAPTYREVERTGPDHAPEFTVAVVVAGYAEASAKGASKRLAEQGAAAAFMARESIAHGPEAA